MATRFKVDPEFTTTATLERYWWKWGRPAEFWIANHEAIGRFIDIHELRPVPRVHLAGRAVRDHMGMEFEAGAVETNGGALEVEATEAQAAHLRPRVDISRPRIAWYGSINGGMRVPHLHFGDRVYLLDHELWAEFSRDMVSRFVERLTASEAIGFEQFMEVTEVMDALPQVAPVALT